MRRLALVGGLGLAVCLWACAQGGSSDIGGLGSEPAFDASVSPDDDAGKIITGSTEDGGSDTGAPKDGGGDVVTTSDAGCTGALVINELQNDGASGTDEFVELYNPTSCAIPLNGYKLMYSSAAGSTPAEMIELLPAHSIAAKGYFVMAGGAFTGTKNVAFASGGLAAGGGRVAIVDSGGKILDAVGYGSLTLTNKTYLEGAAAAPVPASGKSIVRKPDGKDTDTNSADFTNSTASTPGLAN